MVLLFTLWCVLKNLGFFPRPLNITELPYDALHHIFTHLPLVDLLGSVPAVSPAWAEHTSDALRTRRSLALQIGGSPDFPFISYQAKEHWPKGGHPFRDTAYLISHAEQLSESAVNQLIQCLPPIESLFLYLEAHKGPFSEPILTLLTHWSPTLRHLMIKVEKEEKATASDSKKAQTSAQCLTLLRSLAPLRKLVSFLFFYDGYLLLSDAQEQAVDPDGPLDLPLLRQLEHFILQTEDDTDRLLGASYLRYLPEAPSLSGIDWYTSSLTPLTGRYSLHDFSPEVASKFTNIGIPFWEGASLLSLDRLLDRFRNLHTLSLPLTSQLPLASLVATLRRSCCSLTILLPYFDRSPGLDVEISAIERIVDLEAVSLVTVRKLKLINLTISSHRDLECLQIARLFPSIEKLCFFEGRFICRVCGGEDNSKLPLGTFARCLVELTQRFEHLFVKEIPQVYLHAQGERYLLNPQADPPLISDTYL